MKVSYPLHRTASTAIGQSRKAETSYRSIRLKNLPPGTEEGLLQQALEKIANISRVEVFADEMEAVVELASAAVNTFPFPGLDLYPDSLFQEAGKLLMIPDGIMFNGVKLAVTENSPQGVGKVGVEARKNSLFVPRAAMGRRSQRLNIRSSEKESPVPRHSVGNSSKKGQDDFRKMLE